MANSKGKSTDTTSTKSSMLSSKMASLKQSVKCGTKVLGRPFKKLKTSIVMAASSCSIHLHSTVSLPTSEASPSKNCPIEIDGSQSDGTSHSNSVELGPKEELGSIHVTLYMLTPMKLARCIVPPQPWTDIPHIWTRHITFEWWPSSIYAALSSTSHGNHHFCHHHPSHSSFTSGRYLLLSELSHLWATSSAHSH